MYWKMQEFVFIQTIPEINISLSKRASLSKAQRASFCNYLFPLRVQRQAVTVLGYDLILIELGGEPASLFFFVYRWINKL